MTCLDATAGGPAPSRRCWSGGSVRVSGRARAA